MLRRRRRGTRSTPWMISTTSRIDCGELPLHGTEKVIQRVKTASETRPEGIVAAVVDVPGVTATAGTRPETLNLIREQLAPFWKPSELD